MTSEVYCSHKSKSSRSICKSELDTGISLSQIRLMSPKKSKNSKNSTFTSLVSQKGKKFVKLDLSRNSFTPTNFMNRRKSGSVVTCRRNKLGSSSLLKKKKKKTPKHVTFPEDYFISVINVESYKKYNYENTSKDIKHFDDIKCKCLVF